MSKSTRFAISAFLRLRETDEAILSTVEVQLGKMFSPAFGSYMEVLVGVGDDKPYEWGAGVGVRFNY